MNTNPIKIAIHDEEENAVATTDQPDPSALRCEKRMKVVLPLKIWGTDAAGKPFFQPVHTFDVTRAGARLAGVKPLLSVGDVIGVGRGTAKARYRVSWVGDQGTPRADQIGIELLEPEKNIWGFTFPAPQADEFDVKRRKVQPRPEPPSKEFLMAEQAADEADWAENNTAPAAEEQGPISVNVPAEFEVVAGGEPAAVESTHAAVDKKDDREFVVQFPEIPVEELVGDDDGVSLPGTGNHASQPAVVESHEEDLTPPAITITELPTELPLESSDLVSEDEVEGIEISADEEDEPVAEIAEAQYAEHHIAESHIAEHHIAEHQIAEHQIAEQQEVGQQESEQQEVEELSHQSLTESTVEPMIESTPEAWPEPSPEPSPVIAAIDDEPQEEPVSSWTTYEPSETTETETAASSGANTFFETREMESPVMPVEEKQPVAVPASWMHKENADPNEPQGAAVDKIRDLLLGTQIRNYDQRFARLEDTLAREAAEMKESVRRRFESLEAAFKKETETLAARLKTEREERTESLKNAMRDFKATTEVLGRKLADHEHNTSESFGSVRKELAAEVAKLLDEMRQRHDELSAMIEKRSRELNQNKVERSVIANLLSEVANQIDSNADGSRSARASSAT